MWLYLSLDVCHKTFCGTVMVHNGDIGFLGGYKEGTKFIARSESINICLDHKQVCMHKISWPLCFGITTSTTLHALCANTHNLKMFNLSRQQSFHQSW